MNPVSGTIILVDVKAHVPFKTSPLPQDFNELHLFVCGKIVSYKIGDFLMEIRGGKEFLAVTDDESYSLLRERLHNDAGKDNVLANLNIRVTSNNPDDMVCFFC